MNVTIPLPLDPIARRAQFDRVDRGSKPNRVVDLAMNDLTNQDRSSEPVDVAALLAEAEASLARGEGRVWSSELREEIIERAREMIRLGIPPSRHVCP